MPFLGVDQMPSAHVARRTFLATAAAGLYTATSAAASPLGPIRIGQIGVGHAHASKLSVYRNNPDYEVVGIVEPDEQLRKAAQERDPYRDLKWMTREELLNTPGLQAVLVETPVRDLLDHAVLHQDVLAAQHPGDAVEHRAPGDERAPLRHPVPPS